MSDARKSPIKDKPLRQPAQSLEEERRTLWSDKVEPYLLQALMFVVLAFLEWWRYYKDMKPSPIVFTAVAIVAVAFSFWQFFKIRPKMRMLLQGIEGEKVVGQYLERLREKGYDVFHDIVAPGFNIDHVLIGPAGVLTIETKTWSKPLKGDARIMFDGEKLLAGSFSPDRDPINQARAQAAWLRSVLADSTGKTFNVRPVVLFPGWFVEKPPNVRSDVWVLEPKALPAFLDCEPSTVDAQDSKLAAFHLSRFIRSIERQNDSKLA